MIVEFRIDDSLSPNKTSYFAVFGKTGYYRIKIEINYGIPDYKVNDCDCDFGSFYGHSKVNRSQSKVCKHILECLDFLEREAWLDPDWRNKNGTKRKD